MYCMPNTYERRLKINCEKVEKLKKNSYSLMQSTKIVPIDGLKDILIITSYRDGGGGNSSTTKVISERREVDFP